MIQIGIIGYGYWGKNLVRNFNNLDTCKLKYVCEQDSKKANQCHALYPNINVVSDIEILLKDTSLDAIVIATPVNTHYSLGKLALEHDKHVLIEKPLTDSYDTAIELLELAKKRKKVLMVDHTFIYTGAVRYLKEKADSNEYGQINYIDSTRINLGLFQNDVNVLWDLAPHDISICYYLTGNKRPKSLHATGMAHTSSGMENIAYLTLNFEDKLIIHFNCSWVSPVKIRQMLIGGDKKMVLYNDMEPTEKIKVYDTGFKVRSSDEKKAFITDYRVGDIYVPKVPMTEALTLMAQDFIDAVNGKKEPDSSALLGVNVVEILEKAQVSMKNNGKEVFLD